MSSNMSYFSNSTVIEADIQGMICTINIAPKLAVGDIRGTVVACWTAGQQVERLILHLGHDS